MERKEEGKGKKGGGKMEKKEEGEGKRKKEEVKGEKEEGKEGERKEEGKGEGKEKGEKRKGEKEVIIFLGILFFVLIGSFFGIRSYMEKISSFDWHGITFKRMKENGIMYKAEIFFATPERTTRFFLYLHNHPRQLEKIFANITEVKLRKKAYISFFPEVDKCYGSGLAGYKLGEFLYGLGIISLGATTSEDFVTEKKPLITCANATTVSVVLLQPSFANAIYQEKECYIINVSNCETTKAAEAFILNIIKNLMKK